LLSIRSSSFRFADALVENRSCFKAELWHVTMEVRLPWKSCDFRSSQAEQWPVVSALLQTVYICGLLFSGSHVEYNDTPNTWLLCSTQPLFVVHVVVAMG
jgi:hypothetical protein